MKALKYIYLILMKTFMERPQCGCNKEDKRRKKIQKYRSA